MEKFWYNTPFNQILRKLRMNGVRMPKGHNDIDPGKYISFLLHKLKIVTPGGRTNKPFAMLLWRFVGKNRKNMKKS